MISPIVLNMVALAAQRHDFSFVVVAGMHNKMMISLLLLLLLSIHRPYFVSII